MSQSAMAVITEQIKNARISNGTRLTDLIHVIIFVEIMRGKWRLHAISVIKKGGKYFWLVYICSNLCRNMILIMYVRGCVLY